MAELTPTQTSEYSIGAEALGSGLPVPVRYVPSR
jgi:hypothetical protein